MTLTTYLRLLCVLCMVMKPVQSVNPASCILKRLKFDKSMPPDVDSLRQHCRRANYQAAIWRRATTANVDAPDPTTSGWELQDDTLVPVWTTLPCIPVSLQKKCVRCACRKTKCKTGRCACSTKGMSCSDLCLCIDCENKGISSVTNDDKY